MSAANPDFPTDSNSTKTSATHREGDGQNIPLGSSHGTWLNSLDADRMIVQDDLSNPPRVYNPPLSDRIDSNSSQQNPWIHPINKENYETTRRTSKQQR
jgi:hypothetical protein